MFQRRLKMSYPSANLYINQFPKDKTSQTANFVAFLAGAVGAVLATISLLDQESFLSFEITQGRTALFYITISGTVFLVAKGLIPGENEVFAPDYYLGLVLEWLHYMPSEWQNDLHSTRVRDQFAQLFRMKATIFLDEILGLITAPFLLWFVLPRCSDRIVDFFREYTVHVDGLGYVCSSAVFDFQRGPDLATKLRDQMPLTDEAAHDRKMMASYQGFLDQYAAYQPGPHVRAFHPPGHPPSMASPPHLPQIRPPAKQGGQPRNRGSVAPRSRAPLGRSTYSLGRSTKFADGSVGRSMLFDPRNQPTALSPPSHLRQAQRLPRLSPGRRRSEDIAEELNERSNAPSPSPSPQPQPQPPAQVLAVPAVEEHEEDEMSLEGSFVTTRAADNVGDSPGYKASTAALDPDNDVIGLLYQFQKGQTDVRG